MKEFDPGDAPSIASLTDKVRTLPVGMPVTCDPFPRRYRGRFVGAEENAVVVERSGRSFAKSSSTAAPCCAWRPTASVSSPAATTARSSRSTPSGRGHGARDRRKTALDRQRRAASRWRGGVVGRQDRLCPQRQGRGKTFDAPSTVGGLAFAPKGPARWRLRITMA